MPEGNKAVICRFLEEVFSAGNLELVDELFAPDYVLHDPSIPQEVREPEATKQYVNVYRSAYPDTHFTVEDQIAEGEKVVTRWTGQGTHRGELMGVAPTANKVTVRGIEIDRILGDRIEETWVNYDALGMMQQLGVVPPAGVEQISEPTKEVVAVPYALIGHKAEDYERWKPIFDEDAANREANGSMGGYLFRNADDPSELLILFEWDELDNVRQFGQSEELREKMQQAGVADQPDFYFLEEVQRLWA